MIENRRLRRALAAVTAAGGVALAIYLPPNPALFLALGWLWGAVFIIPEMYGN
jgi:hypothetical protein